MTNLGDLEFKVEELATGFSETIAVTDGAIAQYYTDRANHILREKLAKAPEVNCECWNWEKIHETGWYRGKGTDRSTHRARLVAIEKL